MTDRRLRVLHLLVSTQVGGGPRHVHETIRRLGSEEFDWIIGAPDDGPYFARFAELGAVHRLALDRLSPATIVSLARLIRTERVDVIHSHGKGAGFHGRLAARATGVPVVHTYHGIHDAKYGPVGAAAYRAMERTLARMTYRIVSVSRSEAAAGEQLRLWPAGRAQVIPNGIDAAATAALAREQPLSAVSLGARPGEAVVACVARLDPVKGVDTFIRAMARLRELGDAVSGLVVGTGSQERALRALAAQAGVADRVVFAGAVPDAPRLFGHVDVFVSASRGEGLPLAVLEAMACGLPIVATRIPAHEELLGDDAGLLVPVDDPDAVATAVASLLNDATTRDRLREAAPRRVTRYGIDRCAAALADLYRRAAAPG